MPVSISIRLHFGKEKPTVFPCGEPTSQSAGKASDNLRRHIGKEARNYGWPHDVCSHGQYVVKYSCASRCSSLAVLGSGEDLRRKLAGRRFEFDRDFDLGATWIFASMDLLSFLCFANPMRGRCVSDLVCGIVHGSYGRAGWSVTRAKRH